MVPPIPPQFFQQGGSHKLCLLVYKPFTLVIPTSEADYIYICMCVCLKF